jgi:signal transduction histidine kinase
MISRLNNDMLRYVISDNGCGFDYISNASEIHGLDITRERLAILYKGYNNKGQMKIESGAEESGTVITIDIPIIND